jgi:hypothetical protein
VLVGGARRDADHLGETAQRDVVGPALVDLADGLVDERALEGPVVIPGLRRAAHLVILPPRSEISTMFR